MKWYFSKYNSFYQKQDSPVEFSKKITPVSINEKVSVVAKVIILEPIMGFCHLLYSPHSKLLSVAPDWIFFGICTTTFLPRLQTTTIFFGIVRSLYPFAVLFFQNRWVDMAWNRWCRAILARCSWTFHFSMKGKLFDSLIFPHFVWYMAWEE